MVGNRPDAASLEILLGPISVSTAAATVLACAGTDVDIAVAGRAHAGEQAIRAAAGDVIVISTPKRGLRTYLAVRGGFDVEPVLGSRSFDSLGRIGPPPLIVDSTLVIGSAVAGEPWFEQVPVRVRLDEVDLHPGPRADWMSDTGRRTLFSTDWSVDSASDRTGVRLVGPPVERRLGELASEAMIPGAVQLPPGGQPIVLGPDCGVTGGYPVVGVVDQVGLGLLAQLRPGERFRFRPVR